MKMNNIAILVGCQYYKHFGELTGVNYDVQIMGSILKDYCNCDEKNVHIITGSGEDKEHPSGGDIAEFISNILEREKNKRKTYDILFFYFSGHGCECEKELSIIPSNAMLSPTSYGLLKLKQIKSIFDKNKCYKHIVFILDMCQTEYNASKGNNQIDLKSFTGASVIFFSCAPHSKSYMIPKDKGVGSIFTKCFCDILRNSTFGYTVNDISKEIKKHIDTMCLEYGISQRPYTMLEDSSLGELVISSPPQYIEKTECELLQEYQSIWMKDAELADGDQTRFRTFTPTASVNCFIDRASRYSGIASVKGIGKTFLLQVRRMRMTNSALCFPYFRTPSKENNWATESIRFSSDSPFRKGESYLDIKYLWKYSLICYIMHCWLAYCKKVPKSKQNSEYEAILGWLENQLRNNKMSMDTYTHLIDNGYNSLQTIIENVLQIDNWTRFVQGEYTILQVLANKVINAISSNRKNQLVLFIDKLDHAMRQPNSERELECEKCSKSNVFNKCENPLKHTPFCMRPDSESGCPRRVLCCYGCESFSDEYAGSYLRMDNDHFSYWQWLQLAIIEAVSDIQNDYRGTIKVIYTVRLEACNSQAAIFGAQRGKIMGKTLILKYSRADQYAIYRDCIKHQHDSLLYCPMIKNQSGREDEAFVGISGICHPYVNTKESVFDIIYRHSFDRSRDIQDYGQALTEKMVEIKAARSEQERGDIVKSVIEETAARLAYNTDEAVRSSENSYFFEKIPNMPSYWSNTENFESFISCIDRNLLFADDIRRVCRIVNGIERCPSNGCNECSHHPFSALRNLGMLGTLVVSLNQINIVYQSFLDSAEVTYFHDTDSIHLNDHTMYLIHPALTKSIEKLKNGDKIMHFRGFLIGKGIGVKQEILRKVLQDKQRMAKEDFEKAYYQVFNS